jgi:hypothetical protein
MADQAVARALSTSRPRRTFAHTFNTMPGLWFFVSDWMTMAPARMHYGRRRVHPIDPHLFSSW